MIGLSEQACETLVSERVVATVASGASWELRVSLSERDGRTYLVVRKWAVTDSGTVPTKTGFVLAASRTGALIDGLQIAQKALDE